MNDPTFEIGFATDKGRVYTKNEDAGAVFQTTLDGSEPTSGPYPVMIAVVADGIGGKVGGEQASRLAVRTMQAVMQNNALLAIPERLTRAVTRANSQVYNLARQIPALKGMGSTMVAAAIVETQLFLVHVGDSRSYLIRKGRAYQLTQDHSWAQEAVAAGYLSPEQVAQHPNRNVIKRYLGIQPEVQADHNILAMPPRKAVRSDLVPACISNLSLKPGDTILLCSDGLTDMVSDRVLQKIVGKHSAQRAADLLISEANAAGGLDNITAILIHLPKRGRFRKVIWMLFSLIVIVLVSVAVYPWFVFSIYSAAMSF